MTKIALYGYGNLARGVEAAVRQHPDLALTAVFTRRDPASLSIAAADVPVYPASEVTKHADAIDVLILCGGSATDLPAMTPALTRYFHVVDSFDTHADIPAHFAAVDAAARDSGHLALISAGWDPGLFSLARLYAAAVLPRGSTYTFWGKGVSQGHSDALRRIDGVVDARQYTIPREEAMLAVRAGLEPTLSVRDKHVRDCYVVAADGADRERIAREIRAMPHYFDKYDTTVRFVTLEELQREHSRLPHGGYVIRTGSTAENRHTIEYRLRLDSNPEFTGSVLCACARAVARLARRGETGCKTVFDIAPADLSPMSPEEQRAAML